jgi:hypothetical protein
VHRPELNLLPTHLFKKNEPTFLQLRDKRERKQMSKLPWLTRGQKPTENCFLTNYHPSIHPFMMRWWVFVYSGRKQLPICVCVCVSLVATQVQTGRGKNNPSLLLLPFFAPTTLFPRSVHCTKDHRSPSSSWCLFLAVGYS